MSRSRPNLLAVDTDTAAQLIGVSTRTLATWRVRGIGPPFVKLGSGGATSPVRYRVDALKEYVLQCERQSTSAHSRVEGRRP